ncbi:proton channel OtopLc-like isoform X3 [Frieseomelitta varia]|uniref:proton channel OtopLc-like isoform X3 n=1 Tax=Frieseomelitta varia TaxID=561572 RepID=UPI001CB69BA2|nr:proton channel OtopLc-like isoform X3 [Frieseomelitta varia]
MPPRGRASHPRRQSMSLTAVINHRRGLLGALISGIGSNMSLPSCIPQDQEFVTGHAAACKTPLLNNRNHSEIFEKQRPNFLPLSSVNVPMNAFDSTKAKQQMIDQRPKLVQKRKCHAKMVSIVSTLYAKLLIVIGLAVPITASVTERIPTSLNQGFYLYLYVVSVTFVIVMYVIVLRDKIVKYLTQKNKKEQALKFGEDACQALVEETQHEIDQLGDTHDDEDGILKSLLRNASPFLFPCTIEFSLICAVILFEMWKRVDEKIDAKNESPTRSSYHLSIDCSSSHRGLFGGILIIAATILSLIMFFMLKEAKMKIAIVQVTALDATILALGMIASIAGTLKLQALQQKIIKPSDLDTTLLAAAQAGVYLYCLFGVVGDTLTMGPTWVLSLITDLLALMQSTSQTLLIKIAWGRRCSRNDKPGKELITFLIVVNIALWTVNTLEKSRAGVRPDHLRFFGVWAWTIITHVSMPLAIFYRFHSAICLFEIWKTCYKSRSNSVVQTPY